MPKGRVLTPAEREEIVRMHEAGASGREIAKKLTRSKTVVLSFLKNPTQYAQIKRSGRKRALSGDDERRLYAALFQQRSSSVHGDSTRVPIGLHEPSVAQGYTQVSGAASATVTTHEQAATMAQGEAQQHQQQSHPIGLQHMKKSAEQIKKEFNVPLSTRRIQQLLSEWRREAQRVQERQQIAPSQPTESIAEAEKRDTSANIAVIPVTAGDHAKQRTDDQPVTLEGGSEAAATEEETSLGQHFYEAAEQVPTEHLTVADNAAVEL